jgi:alginate O-acetyltransferase complex protein AlgI
MLIVLFGWGIFYFTDITQLFEFTKTLFGIGKSFSDVISLSAFYENIALLPVLILCSLPLGMNLIRKIMKKGKASRLALIWLEPARNALLMFLCVVSIIGSSYNPFLYFRF